MYKPIREMLRHPVANPEIILGGEFITVDTTARKVQSVQAPQQPTPRAHPASSPSTATDLGTTVIDETPLEEPSSTQTTLPSPQLPPQTGTGPAVA